MYKYYIDSIDDTFAVFDHNNKYVHSFGMEFIAQFYCELMNLKLNYGLID